MNWSTKTFVVLAASILLAGVSRGEETYPIKLDAPRKAGDKYYLRAHGTNLSAMLMVMGEQTRGRTNRVSVQLEGKVEVLEVDAGGHETKIACTVDKCVANNGEGPKSLCEKGDVVTAQAANRKKDFRVNGQQASREMASALGIVLTVHTTALGDDELFGSKTTRKPGECWPINTQAALADLNGSGSPLRLKTLQGQACLKGVKTVNGEQCLNVVCNLDSKDLELPAQPSVTVKAASMEARFSGLFPVNRPRIQESLSMKATMKVEMDTPAGAGTGQFLFEQTAERELGKGPGA